jgi:hypothetical protein
MVESKTITAKATWRRSFAFTNTELRPGLDDRSESRC